MDTRLRELSHWASARFVPSGQATLSVADFVSVSDDASFRRYFRCPKLDQSIVIMDAPPDKEPLQGFHLQLERIVTSVAMGRWESFTYSLACLALLRGGCRLQR